MKNDFNIGDKVVVLKTKFSDEEWSCVGKVNVNFKVNDILTICSFHYSDTINGIVDGVDFLEEIANNCWYPISVIKSDYIKQQEEDYSYLIPIFSRYNLI